MKIFLVLFLSFFLGHAPVNAQEKIYGFNDELKIGSSALEIVNHCDLYNPEARKIESGLRNPYYYVWTCFGGTQYDGTYTFQTGDFYNPVYIGIEKNNEISLYDVYGAKFQRANVKITEMTKELSFVEQEYFAVLFTELLLDGYVPNHYYDSGSYFNENADEFGMGIRDQVSIYLENAQIELKLWRWTDSFSITTTYRSQDKADIWTGLLGIEPVS